MCTIMCTIWIYLILFDIIWWHEVISTLDWIPLDSWTIQRTFQTLRARPQLSSGTDHSEWFGGVYWCRFYRCYFMLFHVILSVFLFVSICAMFRRFSKVLLGTLLLLWNVGLLRGREERRMPLLRWWRLHRCHLQNDHNYHDDQLDDHHARQSDSWTNQP